MISKELLNKVLEIDNINDFTLNENVIFINKLECWNVYQYSINIYELAHKCKEFAYSQGYIISSGLTPVLGVNKDGWAEVFSSSTPLDGKLRTFKQLSEPEAIFKACEWILEQNKGK